MEIASGLKIYRHRSGMTQLKLSEQTQTSPQSINKWESDGYRSASFCNFIKIYDVLKKHSHYNFSTEDMRRIGSELKLRRIRLGLTQSDIANSVGVVYQSVHKWESNNYQTTTMKNLINTIGFLEQMSRN